MYTRIDLQHILKILRTSKGLPVYQGSLWNGAGYYQTKIYTIAARFILESCVCGYEQNIDTRQPRVP